MNDSLKSHSNPATHSILIVDDEPDICTNICDILLEFGYDVSIAHDANSALKLLEKKHFEVALLDLKMPGMNGLELCERIKQLQSNTVAIIVTAYSGADTTDSAHRAGAWRIVPKPVDVPRLLSLVEEAVDLPFVMVVDDDHEFCNSLFDVLLLRGFRVAVAHNIEHAESILKSQSLSVALIDMRLGLGDGGEVFDLVRKHRPDSRTILITGYRSETEERIRNALQRGADAICYKPFDMSSLLDEIHRLAKSARRP